MQHVEEAGVHSGDSACVLPGAVAHARERARGRAHRQAARARPRRGRASERPAGDCRLDGLRPGGEPPGLADGPVRVEGDRDQPRRSCLQARLRPEAARARPADAAAAAGQRQGRRAAVRTLPGRRPRARPRDALDGGGDGERLRPADRVREGRACGRTSAAGLGDRVPLGQRQRQAERRLDRRSVGRARLRARRNDRNSSHARRCRARGRRRSRRWPMPTSTSRRSWT